MHSKLSDEIKAEAKNLGFFACGIAKADAVDETTKLQYQSWLMHGKNADMHYLSNYPDKRFDPRLLMDNLKSIVSVALNYTPSHHIPQQSYQFAAYAYGKDYHTVVKNKLHKLASHFSFNNYRIFCDSAPVLERYWAVQAGLGWIGRNHQLIIPQAGSMFFLGELFLDVELEYDKPIPSHCGRCHACTDACPTGAIICENPTVKHNHTDLSTFDAERCLSYQTIENRHDIPQAYAEKMELTIYGCDRCQTACPWNRFSKPTEEQDLQPCPELLSMTKNDWKNLDVKTYQRLFKGSAVKRAKYEGLMRNIKAVENNENQNK